MIHKLSVQIADIPFDIIMYRKTVHTFLYRYFSGFLTNILPEFTIVIDSNKQNPADHVSEQIVPEVHYQSPGYYSIIDNAFSVNSIGSIHTDTKQCILIDTVCRNMYLLTSSIRVCIQFVLEQNQGFFIHAASGKKRGKGILFTGESTAGKSTALHNLKPDKIVTEDAAAIRLIDNSAYLFSIPFKGDHSCTTKLDYICFPHKSKETPALQRVHTSDFLTELTANTLFAAPSCNEVMDTVISTIYACTQTVQGYNCLFYKTTNLNPVFEEYGLFN